MTTEKETYAIGVVLAGVTCFALGISFGASFLGQANGKNWIDFLSMLGSWVSGIGALIAVVVALTIADRQAKNEHDQDAIRCIHHALAVINDLRGRVRSVKLMLTEGGRPVLALTKNAAAIERRYESLYDREIYRHAPGELVDLITSLSGSFFGLSVLVDGVVAQGNLTPQTILPKISSGNSAPLANTLSMLEGKLDTLFDEFVKIREKMSH